MNRHPRPAATARAPAMSDAEARRAWREVLNDAPGIARCAREGPPIRRDTAQLFAHRVIGLRKAPFPVRHVSAQALAEAFLIVARASVAGGHPPTMARALEALAADLGEVLDAQTRAAFARSCRVAGDVGE